MKKSIPFLFTLFFLLINAYTTIGSPVPYAVQQESLFDLERTEVLDLDKKGLEQRLNRKLTFKEKVALPFVKRKLKKYPKLSTAEATEYAKLNGLALASFIVGLVSLLFAGIILGICAIVFGGIALNKIEKFPDEFRGRGFAAAGMILGGVGVIGALIFILRMM
ncbi:MAG: DUF4190 domain-containing protein [Bacteroidota bacterium]